MAKRFDGLFAKVVLAAAVLNASCSEIETYNDRVCADDEYVVHMETYDGETVVDEVIERDDDETPNHSRRNGQQHLRRRSRNRTTERRQYRQQREEREPIPIEITRQEGSFVEFRVLTNNTSFYASAASSAFGFFNKADPSSGGDGDANNSPTKTTTTTTTTTTPILVAREVFSVFPADEFGSERCTTAAVAAVGPSSGLLSSPPSTDNSVGTASSSSAIIMRAHCGNPESSFAVVRVFVRFGYQHHDNDGYYNDDESINNAGLLEVPPCCYSDPSTSSSFENQKHIVIECVFKLFCTPLSCGDDDDHPVVEHVGIKSTSAPERSETSPSPRVSEPLQKRTRVYGAGGVVVKIEPGVGAGAGAGAGAAGGSSGGSAVARIDASTVSALTEIVDIIDNMISYGHGNTQRGKQQIDIAQIRLTEIAANNPDAIDAINSRLKATGTIHGSNKVDFVHIIMTAMENVKNTNHPGMSASPMVTIQFWRNIVAGAAATVANSNVAPNAAIVARDTAIAALKARNIAEAASRAADAADARARIASHQALESAKGRPPQPDRGDWFGLSRHNQEFDIATGTLRQMYQKYYMDNPPARGRKCRSCYWRKIVTAATSGAAVDVTNAANSVNPTGAGSGADAANTNTASDVVVRIETGAGTGAGAGAGVTDFGNAAAGGTGHTSAGADLANAASAASRGTSTGPGVSSPAAAEFRATAERLRHVIANAASADASGTNSGVGVSSPAAAEFRAAAEQLRNAARSGDLARFEADLASFHDRAIMRAAGNSLLKDVGKGCDKTRRRASQSARRLCGVKSSVGPDNLVKKNKFLVNSKIAKSEIWETSSEAVAKKVGSVDVNPVSIIKEISLPKNVAKKVASLAIPSF